MIVHANSADASGDGVTAQFAAQLRSDVLQVNRYGDLAVYRIDDMKALKLLSEAMTAMTAQVRHLREGIAVTYGNRSTPPLGGVDQP